MDIMELGAIGELVGGLAVITTLIYLARQMRLAAVGARFTAQQSLAQQNSGYTALTLSDPDHLRIQHHLLGEGLDQLRNPDGLAEDDLRRAFGLFYCAFSILENQHKAWRAWLLLDPDWQQTAGIVGAYARSDASRDLWGYFRDYFEADFVDFVDREMTVSPRDDATEPS